MALLATPREEEPQIVVPFADVIVDMPGATAAEVENLVATPLEAKLWEIDGVEYVYSQARPGQAVVTVRFFVGQDRERSLVKVWNKVMSNQDAIPQGVTGWMVKPVEIDDVPIVLFTLSSSNPTYDGAALRRVADEVLDKLGRVANTGRRWVVGGEPRQVTVYADPGRMAARGVSLLEVVRALEAANLNVQAGRFERGGADIALEAGPFFRSADEVGAALVASPDGRPVYVRDVARVVDGPAEAESYTRIGFGPAAASARRVGAGAAPAAGEERPAVTVAVAKRKGTNAVRVAEEVIDTVGGLRGAIIPDEVDVHVTRDYGETANHKVNELVKHLLIAIATIIVLLAIALGPREALIVAIAVPMTLAITLLLDLLFGYTINRVTLFALILSLGLLVDDPIVDVENIFRHFRLRREPPLEATLTAVDEVRPPTILATFTVIVSFLPMFFITGMMGPYMAPMAFNVPVAMLMSLIVAFTVTPWAAYHLLKGEYDKGGEEPFDLHRSTRLPLVPAALLPLLRRAPAGGAVPRSRRPRLRRLGAARRHPRRAAEDAAVRQQERAGADHRHAGRRDAGSDRRGGARPRPLPRRRGRGDRLRELRRRRRADGFQRHGAPLLPAPRRQRRRGADQFPAERGAGAAVARDRAAHPPRRRAHRRRARRQRQDRRGAAGAAGDLHRRRRGLRAPRRAVRRPHRGVEDACAARWPRCRAWSTSTTSRRRRTRWCATRSTARRPGSPGVSVAEAAQTLAVAVGGGPAGRLHAPHERLPIGIDVRLPRETRSSAADLMAVRVKSGAGALVPLGEIGSAAAEEAEQVIYHKNLRPVAFVIAEMAGRSPVEAVLAMFDWEDAHPLPPGYAMDLAGEGEWKITVDVFRDLGLAFAAALAMIYVLLVAQTGSLGVPLVIMIAIPLTLIGIMPGLLAAQPAVHLAGRRLRQPGVLHRHRHDRHDRPGRHRRPQLDHPDRLHRAHPRPRPGAAARRGDRRGRRHPPAADRAHRRGGDVRLDRHHPRSHLLRPGVELHLRHLRLDRVHAAGGAGGLLSDLSPPGGVRPASRRAEGPSRRRARLPRMALR